MKEIAWKTLVLFFLFQIADITVFSVLKSGMDHYYGMDEPAQLLCIGHSHTVLGIDAELMETELGFPVAKYATSGANTLDRLWMIRQYVEEHPSIKAVVYDVDARLFDSEGLSSASYTLFLPYIGNADILKYIKEQASWQEYWASRLIRTTRFRDQTLNIALRGLLDRVENKKSSRIRVEDYSAVLEREKNRKIRINPLSLESFNDAITYLTQKEIEIYFVFVPVIDLLNNIDPVNQAKVVDIFKETASKHGNVHFIDYNQEYQSNHNLFYDLRHLNKDGNELVTALLIEELKKSMKFSGNEPQIQ